MLRKLFRDFNANKNIRINENNRSKELGCYYILFEEDISSLNRLIHSFDAEGIPLNTTYIDVTNGRLHYYPISIGQYGLALFHSWLKTGSEEKKAHFLRIADWFMATKQEDPSAGTYWLTDIPKPEYKVYSPWKSAFTQSRALSVLLRAWQLTGKESYLQAATGALIPFDRDISGEGVSVDRELGETIYEEYVAAAPTRVLDGHFFSLFGLYDYVRAVPEKEYPESHRQALRLFTEGMEGIIRQLPRYDLGFWLRFNRCDLPDYPQNDPCTIGYLRLVRQQLLILHQISGRNEFKHFAGQCRKYDRLPNILRMYRLKLKVLKQLNRI